MPENMEETARNLMGSFKRLHKILYKSTFQNLAIDLKPSPFFVMMRLLHASREDKVGLRVSEIASDMGISVPGITQIITTLEKEGFILREMDPRDRRAIQVSLTKEGKKILEPAFRKLETNFFGLIEHLGKKNSEVLASLLIDVEEYFME